MRSRIFTHFAALIVFLAALASFAYAADQLAGFELCAENEFLELYYKADTAEIAVVHKETGAVWFSNPPGRDKQETLARGASKSRLSSQLVLTYYYANQQQQMDSFNDSVAYGQYEITPLENGLRVKYKFGKVWQDRDYLPTIISEERFNELILANIPREKDREFLRDMYGLFSLEEGYDSGEDLSIMGVDFDRLLQGWGIKVDEPRFRTNDKRRLFQEYLVLIRDHMKYDSLGEVKPEEIVGLRNTPTLLLKWNVMQWDVDDAVQLVKAAGYTPEDVAYDHEYYSVAPPYPDLRQFEITVEYLLDGDELVVRVPTQEIRFPDKVWDPKNEQEVSYPLTAISVLPYFGAGSVEDQGYMFVPDGAGALIYFNRTSPLAEPYSRRVYGQDHAAIPLREYSSMLKGQIYLPVFGVVKNEQAFLAIIEEGDAAARIEAMLPGMRDSYNKVWASFEVRSAARVNMQAEGELIHLRQLSILMYQARLNQSDTAIRYVFLPREESSYAGMARAYQDYLVEKHGLSKLDPGGKLPLIVDVIGSFDHVQPVLGIPTNVVEPFTTHEQTKLLVEDLLAEGVDSLRLRYLGWLRGGIRHVYPRGAPLERAVGNSRSWQQLNRYLEELGVDFYPSVDFLQVHRNSPIDLYFEFLHAPRGLDRSGATLNTFHIATYQPIDDRKVALLSPARLAGVVDSFLKGYERHGTSGLALGDLGLLLYADYRLNPSKLVDRVMAAEIIAEQVSRLAKDRRLMIAGSNAYLLPYAEVLVEAPLYARGEAILHQTVPFYAMVVSGYMEFAGEPFNLADHRGDFYLLKLLETGAAPYFALTWEPSSLTKNTDFDYLFSTYYPDIKGDVLAVYNTVREVLGDAWPAAIVDHKVLAHNVCETTYHNGLRVVVNYTSQPHRLPEGLVVPAVGYVVLQGGN